MRYMTDITRKKVLLGITGGVAAYKAAELVRRLMDLNIEVQVVMTQAATQFITPLTLQALSGRSVYTDLWDGRIPNNMAHIELSRDKDAILIAPASADFMAKLAHGLADDLLSTLCLARDCPLLVAPAMNRQMWENPATQRNVATLTADKVTLLGPASGEQACGEVGQGRMLEALDLAESMASFLAPKPLQGISLLITAGPTFEPIDAVRGITNLSSGKMGYALARSAQHAGANVTLISGPVSLPLPLGVNRFSVQSAQQMFQCVKEHVQQCDVFVAVAAVADYRVEKPYEQKIKKTDATELTLSLVPNTDILAWVASQTPAPFTVGFAAESEHLEKFADEKRRRKKVSLMIANLAQQAIGKDDNEVTILDDKGVRHLPRANKTDLANTLILEIAKAYRAEKK
jgi:phosphopantothenoylcysteine decarboxylase/phosphopantothenate--cysteine ligase